MKPALPKEEEMTNELPLFYNEDDQQFLDEESKRAYKIIFRECGSESWKDIQSKYSAEGSDFIDTLYDVYKHKESGLTEEQLVKQTTNVVKQVAKSLSKKYPDFNID